MASSSTVVLFRLIEDGDWQQLNDIFLSNPKGAKTFQKMAASVASSTSFNGMTILHAIARYDPPPLIVKRIIQLCPQDTMSTDCLNRTPLHVAAGSGAHYTVINVLADAYPRACNVKDHDGRVPLHLACDTSCSLFEDYRPAREARISHKTIDALLRASPDAATAEDEDGMCAIEYALISDAKIETVRLIQKASQTVLRELAHEKETKAGKETKVQGEKKQEKEEEDKKDEKNLKSLKFSFQSQKSLGSFRSQKSLGSFRSSQRSQKSLDETESICSIDKAEHKPRGATSKKVVLARRLTPRQFQKYARSA